MTTDVSGSNGRQGEDLDFDTVMAPVSSGSAPTRLSPVEQSLLALVDGRRAVSALLWASGLSATDVLRTLATLEQRGLVVRQDRASSSMPDTPPPELVSAPAPRPAPAPAPAPRPAPDPAPVPAPAPAPVQLVTRARSATPARREEAPPEKVGSYEVITRMAQGGFGSIYLCQRTGALEFRRLFTLKAIREHGAEIATALKAFRREAEVGALLRHPNVLPVLDVGSYDGQPFLILEYVEGASLADLMIDGQGTDASLLIPVMVDVLRALQCAHDLAADGKSLGLVHGDLSPQNILVGTDGAARLTDFGSAHFGARSGEASADWTMVKPAYMAPEQLRGEPVDARSDLFSAGVVLWSALTGQKLFADAGYEQTVMNVLRKKIPPPSTFGAPRSLDEICARALSRTREGRFASAEEMVQALLKVGATEGLLGGAQSVGRWVRVSVGDVLAERQQRIRDVADGTVAAKVIGSPPSPAPVEASPSPPPPAAVPAPTARSAARTASAPSPEAVPDAIDSELTDSVGGGRGRVWLVAIISALVAALVTAAVINVVQGRL